MKKIYKKLSKEQIKRGVFFASTLSTQRTEMEGDHTHEVIQLKVDDFKDKPAYALAQAQREQAEEIARLKNDKFFNASHFKYNIIRTRI